MISSPWLAAIIANLPGKARMKPGQSFRACDRRAALLNFPPMRRLCWLVILFQLFWLNVVVPGHVRGRITVAGTEPARSACCKTNHDPARQKNPTRDEQGRCAVCSVAAGYTLPPVYDFDHRPDGETFIRALQLSAQIVSPAIPRTYDANGPPSV